MRIVFIGTSHGVPEAHQRCSCTMIEIGDRRYFIDMGTQAIEDLRKRNIAIDSVKGIFITHMHGDHTDGLISFVDIINWYFKTADPVIQLPEEEAIDALWRWLDVNGSGRRELRLDVVKEGVTYEDEVLSVTSFRTQHCRNSYSYLLEAEGKRVLFTGDLSGKGPETDFPRQVLEEETDLVICEAAHFPAEAYQNIFRDGKVKRVCYNHYAPWNIPHIQTMITEMAPLPIQMANDGMEITL